MKPIRYVLVLICLGLMTLSCTDEAIEPDFVNGSSPFVDGLENSDGIELYKDDEEPNAEALGIDNSSDEDDASAG